jgi:citronellol/citronellal dehydrogenase
MPALTVKAGPLRRMVNGQTIRPKVLLVNAPVRTQGLGTEAEVSAAIVYLLSPAASYITGSCIRIDGGAPNARRGWWDLQPAKNNVAFDGFHRSSLPAILDEVP